MSPAWRVNVRHIEKYSDITRYAHTQQKKKFYVSALTMERSIYPRAIGLTYGLEARQVPLRGRTFDFTVFLYRPNVYKGTIDYPRATGLTYGLEGRQVPL